MIRAHVIVHDPNLCQWQTCCNDLRQQLLMLSMCTGRGLVQGLFAFGLRALFLRIEALLLPSQSIETCGARCRRH